MDVATAIRTRRTHKAYRPQPVERELLDELLELARWAPNHHLTNPWRFRVIGPEARERLKQAAGPEAAVKLERAPTLVVCTGVRSGDPIAVYIVLLAAHARGLVGYWRTPEVLRSEAGRAALGIGDDERFVAMIHLGYPAQEKPAPEREPVAKNVEYLP